MTNTLIARITLLLLLSTPAFANAAGSGILHGFVTDSNGAPVTNLTAVVTHLEGAFPFSGSQALTASGEFVLQPPIGAYLIELENGAGDVVDYRTGINIFDDITTFLLFTVDQPTVCQTNLGAGSAGGMTLTVCGDALTTPGSSATLNVYNATPGQVVFAPIGVTNAPTPFKGGTLVPLPWTILLPLSADTFGRISLPVPGSAGAPTPVYMQVIDANGDSFRFSNAVELVIGV